MGTRGEDIAKSLGMPFDEFIAAVAKSFEDAEFAAEVASLMSDEVRAEVRETFIDSIVDDEMAALDEGLKARGMA